MNFFFHTEIDFWVAVGSRFGGFFLDIQIRHFWFVDAELEKRRESGADKDANQRQVPEFIGVRRTKSAGILFEAQQKPEYHVRYHIWGNLV